MSHVFSIFLTSSLLSFITQCHISPFPLPSIFICHAIIIKISHVTLFNQPLPFVLNCHNFTNSLPVNMWRHLRIAKTSQSTKSQSQSHSSPKCTLFCYKNLWTFYLSTYSIRNLYLVLISFKTNCQLLFCIVSSPP